MISFLAATGVIVNLLYAIPSAEQIHLIATNVEPSHLSANNSENNYIGKFIETNWLLILGFIIFLIRLQNSVEDIKKDNQHQMSILVKDFELIKSSLQELQKQIQQRADKNDLEHVRLRQKDLNKTLHQLIEFINENRSLNEHKFKIKDYNSNADDADD